MKLEDKYKQVLNEDQYNYCKFLRGITHGAVVLAGTGSGKTLMTLLTPLILGETEFVIFVPAKSLNDTKKECDKFSALIPELKKVSNRIFSSSMLSTSAPKLLETTRPSLIIIDEVQDFAAINTARGQRLFKYLDSDLKGIKLVCLSATLITLQIKQSFYLLSYALRNNSPFRLDDSYIQVYQGLLDNISMPGEKKAKTVNSDFSEYPGRTFSEKLGEAIKACPAVFSTYKYSTSVPINFKKVTEPVNDEINIALEKLEKEWELPNGTKITDAAVINHAEKTIGCGYYFVEEHEEGTASLHKAKEKVAAFNKAARNAINYDPKVDSIRTFKNLRASDGILERLMLEASAEKKKIKRRVEFIDSSFVVNVVETVSKKVDNLAIWVEHVEVGALIADRLSIPFLRDGKKPVPVTARFVVFSIQAFYAGKNLQQFNNALILEPTVNPLIFEQLVSRHHRFGQTKPVTIYLNCTNKNFLSKWVRLQKRSTKISALYQRPFKFSKKKP